MHGNRNACGFKRCVMIANTGIKTHKKTTGWCGTGMLRKEQKMTNREDPFCPLPTWFTFGDGRYRITVAGDLETRKKAYHLVYKAYLEKRYANANASEMWVTKYDALPETVTFLVEYDEEPIGSLTVLPDSPLGLAADDLYKEELDGLRNRGCRLAELISFGVKCNTRDIRVMMMLFNAVYLYAYRVANLTDLVMTVNPRHAKFYRSAMSFTNLGLPRNYAKVNYAPACAEHICLRTGEQFIGYAHSSSEEERAIVRSTLYRYFLPPAEEALFVKMIRQALNPMTQAEMSYFFADQPDVLAEISPKILQAV
jgi:hypothetical protein